MLIGEKDYYLNANGNIFLQNYIISGAAIAARMVAGIVPGNILMIKNKRRGKIIKIFIPKLMSSRMSDSEEET